MGYFKFLRERKKYFTFVKLHNQLEVSHCFNIRLCYIFFGDVIFLQSWVSGDCYNRKQIPCENQCGIQNEESIQPYFKVCEVVQYTIGIYIPLLNNCG